MTSLVQLASAPPAAERLPGDHPASGPVKDRFGRIHSDLRISVTDRCNIRCFYCMPESGATFAPAARLLTDAQIVQFVSAAVPLGFRTLRITGGEPLLRPRLAQLLERVNRIPGIEDLAVTTNAVLLEGAAEGLLRAGVQRLNIHLDTLDRERFRVLARRDELGRVLAGIERALSLPFRSIKLNAVAVRGFNEPDLVPLVRFARERKLQIRFIEFMPLDAERSWSREQVLTASEMIGLLEREFGPLTPVPGSTPSAPASDYQFEDGSRVGFIASVSRPFCADCNRLRLTSDGKLRNCLFALQETDIRSLLDDPAARSELEDAIRGVVWRKWAGHQMGQPGFAPPDRAMYAIGG